MGVQVTVWPRGNRRTKVSGPFGIDWDAEPRFVPRPVFANQYGKLVDVKTSTSYADGIGGHDLASWRVQPFGGYIGGMFRPGDAVRVTKGGGTGFDGEFSEAEPNDDGTVTLHARGHRYDLISGYDSIRWQPIPASDDIYYPTTKLGSTTQPAGDAVHGGWQYAAYILGMPINQVVGSTGAWADPYGSESSMAPAPVKLGALVEGIAQLEEERASVWGRTLVIAPDPTTAQWAYDASDSIVGVADSDYATHVGVWFVSTDLSSVQPWNAVTAYTTGNKVSYGGLWWQALVGSTNVTPVEGSTWTEIPLAYRSGDFSMVWAIDNVGLRRFDARTVVVDMRGLGAMSSPAAQTIADTLLSQVRGRFMLTGSFTIGPESGFTSASGGKADVAFVRAGQALQLANVRTSQGNLLPDNGLQVIGRTEWSWEAEGGTEQTQVTPMGAVPRNLGEILRGSPIDAAAVVSGARRVA